jgi:splicing factor 3B subunit 2
MAVVAGTLPGLDIDEQVDEAALEQQIAAQLMGCKTHNAARNQKKRQKQKERKSGKGNDSGQHFPEVAASQDASAPQLTYVSPELPPDLPINDPRYAEIVDVFKKFNSLGRPREDNSVGAEPEPTPVEEPEDVDVHSRFKSSTDELSNKAKKKLLQLSVASLKQSVEHSEVVEAHDVTATDPKLLIYLKASRNSVPVPRHWSAKSKYLQRKVGLDKPPFQLPGFIDATGISKMRGADLDSAADKSLKGKQRDRYLPKMGKIEIDYQILHDAFFVHQTKPKLSAFGELYFQGKEFEMKHNFKPGQLSEKLRSALGMTDGSPPPWLFKMQQFGPPPSYPSLKIPGVNAPIPPGASYGGHQGGWGQPPVDEYGRPLYGDVFGTSADSSAYDSYAPRPPKSLWGELSSVDTSAAGLSLKEQPPMPAAVPEPEGAAPPEGEAAAIADGTASVATSMISGMETPDVVDLRKGGIRKDAGFDTPQLAAEHPPALYQILEEKRTGLTGGLLGTSHGYVVPTGPQTVGAGVAVTLNPEELENLDEATLAKKYQAELNSAAATRRALGEGVSEVIEEQERKRKRTEAGLSSAGGNKSKKSKDFKF